jgi:hypothetical protein
LNRQKNVGIFDRLTFRFSLRSFFAIVTFLSVACIALKYAGPLWWTILSSISLVLFMGAAVTAFVGRDKLRAFGVGFAVCSVVYGLLVFMAGSDELDPYKSRLPTSTLLRHVFRLVSVAKWIDPATHKEIPNYQPTGGEMGGGMMSGGTFGMRAYHIEFPSREQFMPIGHLMWLDLLGFVGGLFACFIYDRTRQDAGSANVNAVTAGQVPPAPDVLEGPSC